MVALLDSTGGRRETIAYSAFGVPFGRPGADVSGDGLVSAPDFNLILVAFGESVGDPNYSVVADINLDGSVNALDANLYSGHAGYTLGRGTLSRSPSLAGGVGNRTGYAGYAWEPSSSKYHVRNRVLDPVRGRWNRRDALGYIDGPTMYAYVSNRAMSATDPSGLFQRKIPQLQPVCPEIVEAGESGQIPLGDCAGMGGAGPGVGPSNGGCDGGSWSKVGDPAWTLRSGTGTSGGCTCTFEWCQTWVCSTTQANETTCDTATCKVTTPNIDSHDCVAQCGTVDTSKKTTDLSPGCAGISTDPPKKPK